MSPLAIINAIDTLTLSTATVMSWPLLLKYEHVSEFAINENLSTHCHAVSVSVLVSPDHYYIGSVGVQFYGQAISTIAH